MCAAVFAHLKVWSLATRKEDEILKPRGASGFASFSPDGKTLVTSGPRFFSVLSGNVIAPLQDCTTMITGIAFNRDGKTLAAIDSDLVKLWDVSTGKLKGIMASGHDLALVNIAFSTKGDLLATAGGYVKLWDMSTGKEVGQSKPKFGSLRSVVFSPDDKLLATLGTDLKANVQIWDGLTRVAIHDIQIAGKTAHAIAFHPKGRVLATAWEGKSEGEITLHDVKAKTEVGRIKGFTKRISSLAFSPDGSTLASATFGSGVRLWDVATEKETKSLKSSTGSVYGLSFSPDGTIVAGIEGRTVLLWDVASGKMIAALKGHTDVITQIQFNPDGKMLASGSADATIRLWDVPALKK
jgi:WD40 repeat protein